MIWALVRVIGVRPALAPAIFGTMAVLGTLESILDRAYPGSSVGHQLAVVLLAAVTWTWGRELSRAPAA